jgi:3-phenylpropionate/trans-cinnamate dioxygenase ferredoxin subunit
MTEPTFLRALHENDLPPGEKKAVDLAGRSILICHVGGRFFAVSNICSHAEKRLECGRMGNGWIACPIHGARFDLASGKPRNPPAKRPIATYAVRLVEGWVEVEMP